MLNPVICQAYHVSNDACCEKITLFGVEKYNRVILPYWQLSHLANSWGMHACLVSKEAKFCEHPENISLKGWWQDGYCNTWTSEPLFSPPKRVIFSQYESNGGIDLSLISLNLFYSRITQNIYMFSLIPIQWDNTMCGKRFHFLSRTDSPFKCHH